ncbi:MAG TPA: delta-60 repeat domain-containing protein [Rhodanobacteraceae bacterium]|nr:delta-60 repeat domain-containing protein [Rhodanobacteraceae bacterium]
MKTLAAAIFAALAMLPAQRAYAGAGSLDPGFGGDGVVILPSIYPASSFDSGAKVAIQADGKIVVVGRAGGDASGIWRSAFLAVRLNPDGSLDTSFGPDHDGYFILPWGGVASNATSVLIDMHGDIVIGGNEGHRAAVVWLRPDGTVDASQGPEGNGTANFAVNDDDAHTTTLNAMTLENPFGGGTYHLDFAGTYDGAGFQQMMLGSYNNPGPYDPQPNPFITVIVPPGTNGNGVVTSLLDNGDAGVIYGGYAQDASGSTQCVVGASTDDICHVVGDDVVCGWFAGDAGGNFANPFVDQIFSTEFGTAAPCYVDAIMRPPVSTWTVAAGREFFAGGTRAVYFTLDGLGDFLPYFNVFAMTPWGDNSPREVLAQRDGKWLLAGFSGADLSNISDPVVARVRVIDGALDPGFGAGGVSLLDFDLQDYAHGETYGAALDAHGCIVSVGTYYNGNSDEGGRDFSQVFVSRVEGDSGGANDTIFRDGFDLATPVCGP